MNTTNSSLEANIENELKQNINVILWHILVSKIFLYWLFEEYFVNFFINWEFSLDDYLKSIRYLEEVLAWDNFVDRYSDFERKAEEIIASIKKKEWLLDSLLESFTYNLPYIIWKKDEHWIIEWFPYDRKFLDNKQWIQVVKNWINQYIDSEINKLKQLIRTPEVVKIRSNLIEWLRKLQILS